MSFTLLSPTSSNPVKERRATKRRRVGQLITAKFGADNGGILIDVSEGGAQFQSVEEIAAGDKLSVQFLLTGQVGAIRAAAQVVWCNESGKGGGLKFTGISDTDQHRIRDWVDEEAKENAPAAGSPQGSAQAPARSGHAQAESIAADQNSTKTAESDVSLEMARLLVSARGAAKRDGRGTTDGSAAPLIETAIGPPVESTVDPGTFAAPEIAAGADVMQAGEDLAAPSEESAATAPAVAEQFPAATLGSPSAADAPSMAPADDATAATMAEATVDEPAMAGPIAESAALDELAEAEQVSEQIAEEITEQIIEIETAEAPVTEAQAQASSEIEAASGCESAPIGEESSTEPAPAQISAAELGDIAASPANEIMGEHFAPAVARPGSTRATGKSARA